MKLRYLVPLPLVLWACIVDSAGEANGEQGGATTTTTTTITTTVATGGQGPTTSVGGAGAAGAAGGTGSGGGCSNPSDCPPAAPCFVATCQANVCDETPAPRFDACSDGGNTACDGAGNCRLSNGNKCVALGECASGNCIDDTCCGAASCGECQACNTAAMLGECGAVAPGIICGASGLCDSGGTCANGNPVTAAHLPGSGAVVVVDIATDANDNIIVVGDYSGSLDLPGGTPSTGDADIFIVKYDSAFNIVWVDRLGGAQADNVSGVATDAQGDVYVSLSTDNPQTGVVEFNAAIAKFNSAGGIAWYHDFGGDRDDTAEDIAVGPSGKVVFVGSFRSPSFTLGIETYTKLDDQARDAFIAEINPATGAIINSRAFQQDNTTQRLDAVTLDAAGNAYATGWYNGSFLAPPLSVAAGAGAHIAVVKLANDFSTLGLAGTSGIGNDFPNAITLLASGHVMVGAEYRETLVIDSNTTLTNTGALAGVLIDYNFDPAQPNGVAVADVVDWFDPNANSTVQGLAVDANGNLIVVGVFAGMFGGFTATAADGIVQKVATDGTILWGAHATSDADDNYALAAAAATTGDVLVGGLFQSTTFTVGGSAVLNAVAGADGYVAKIAP